MNNKISVYLITGFLGAGKTTILNHFLKSKVGQRNVVIENEFGKASVDGSLITKSYSEMYELSNGCICCSLDEELYDVLGMLANAAERPHNLFIETTGIADAGSVAGIFTREDISKVFDLKRVICIADAETVEDYLDETNETIRQLVSADLIIINKTQFVSPEYIVKLGDMMRKVNPFAELLFSAQGDIPGEVLEGAPDEERVIPESDQGIVVGTNKHKIVTVTYKTDHEFYKDYLLHTLNVSLMLHYRQIYRIKGFIKLEGNPDKVLLQSTGKRLTLESYGAWETERPVSELVFIGVGLQTPAIQRILRPAIKTVKTTTLKENKGQ